MHKTEASGNVAGAYVDQSLPTVAGTVLAASDRNATQDEVVNVILRAGLALKTAATETGDQLETVIFDTVITRTAALKAASGPSADYGAIVPGGVEASSADLSHSIAISPDAITHTPALGDPCRNQWAEISTTQSGTPMTWTFGSNVFTFNSNLTLPGIAHDARVKSISMSWSRTGGCASSPVYADFTDTGSGSLLLKSGSKGMSISDPGSGADHKLLIVFDDAGF